MRVAVQMDPLESIKIGGDSTFALMLEAQRRGHALFVYQPENLSLSEGRLTARGRHVAKLQDEVDHHVTWDHEAEEDLSAWDVVWLRQDPPFDMNYITTTHMLEHLPPRTQVLNNPMSVRNAPEKIWVLEFQDLMPATLISRDREAIKTFRQKHGDVVMKPLYGNGGRGVFLVRQSDPNTGSIIDMFMEQSREPWVTQVFLPNIVHGDKRIILIDGEPKGAINRVPAQDDIRANLVRGGTALVTDLSPQEQNICKRLGPVLKEKGLLFVGIDVIDGLLTEINVTSPTGLRAIERLTGQNLASDMWDVIEARHQQKA